MHKISFVNKMTIVFGGGSEWDISSYCGSKAFGWGNLSSTSYSIVCMEKLHVGLCRSYYYISCRTICKHVKAYARD